MYCHTAKERSEWLRENITVFKKVKEIKMFDVHENTVLKFGFSIKVQTVFCLLGVLENFIARLTIIKLH